MLMTKKPERICPQKAGKTGDNKETFGHKRRKRRIYVQEAKEAWT